MNTFDNESVRRISAAVRHVEGVLAEGDFRPVDPVAPKVVAALKITAISAGATPAQAQVVTYDAAGDSWLVVSSAVEILGESLTVDEIVHGMLIGYRASTKKAVYLASTGVAALDSVYLPLVTKVCLSGLPDTVVPDGDYGYPFDEDTSGSDETTSDTQSGASITVERRVVTLPGDTPLGPPVCLTDPDDCCEADPVWPPDYPASDPAFVRVGCCDNRQISVESSAVLDVISGTGPCLDGTIFQASYDSSGRWYYFSGPVVCAPVGLDPVTYQIYAWFECTEPGCGDGWPCSLSGSGGWDVTLIGQPINESGAAGSSLTWTNKTVTVTSCNPLTLVAEGDFYDPSNDGFVTPVTPIRVRLTFTATTEA